MSAQAYAVIDNAGHILSDTIFPTPRGAMVNWLVVYGQKLVTANWSDSRIEAEFKAHADPIGSRVAQVRVEVVQ